ncbi:hypothetical protein N7519_003710 [Penicillium mononematosum]|uniref:uncharacterized protein n=1 Tax=Penicillium mononematosum TaxID=268346 RepID=UPI00254733E3|nr:uncharacterized protein N7519_003710 [Penicillium mononematosum]KAJ6188802.1 hypothetical protein N7519_003710 [Penicillium mononematosum]
MYYILYLTSLCRRRNWPEPIYNAYTSNSGYTCTVRVNNREYRTDGICSNETLARESAAMRAYLICRNFSVNDGMYPVGHEHGGAVQGCVLRLAWDGNLLMVDLFVVASGG